METNWDPAKARANLARHGIAFEDAEVALYDPAGLTREDPDAEGEARSSPSAPTRWAGSSPSSTPTAATTSG